MSLKLIATSAFGLEAIVGRELMALGYTDQSVRTGAVHFSADAAAISRANLWLRTSDRVQICMGQFEATDFGVLFDDTFAIDWQQWLPVDAEFPVNGRSLKSQLSSVPACQKIVKKAIVEKLRAAYKTQMLPETGPKYTIEVAMLKDQVTLTLDTTGPGLNKRGYRDLTGAAQLKETLSAALVLLSFWKAERPMIDPFCGTGTIPIEAAMIGRNIAPGRNRWYVSQDWPALEKKYWNQALEESDDLVLPPMTERIVATDIDGDVLSLARRHARRAGVEEDIHFQQRAFSDLLTKRTGGCLITNPPYGHRIGELDEIEALYQSMPNILRRLKTWSHFILTAYPEFEKIVGQRANRRRKLYNARIECTYFQFHGPKPGVQTNESIDNDQQADIETDNDSDESFTQTKIESPVIQPTQKPKAPSPAFGGLKQEATRQAEEFRNRLIKRAKHLRRWPTKRGISCFRIYERDIPEVPLVVDRYEDHLHIIEFERPHERTVAQHADWLDLMVRTACDALQVDRKKTFFKSRQRQQGTTQHERLDNAKHEIVVNEGGLKFYVNLSDYIDTGLFLDHRTTREMVRQAAKDRDVLNLFAYTGSFSVYAAAGEASSTTTVDMSKTYLDWARRNMELNGFRDPKYQYVQSDVEQYLANHVGDQKFDLAIVDPPTFSNSKRMENLWDIQRDHVKLLNQVIEFLRPAGILFFSTNFRRFKLDEAEIQNVTIREITKKTLPEEYRNQRIHKCWTMVRE